MSPTQDPCNEIKCLKRNEIDEVASKAQKLVEKVNDFHTWHKQARQEVFTTYRTNDPRQPECSRMLKDELATKKEDIEENNTLMRLELWALQLDQTILVSSSAKVKVIVITTDIQ